MLWIGRTTTWPNWAWQLLVVTHRKKIMLDLRIRIANWKNRISTEMNTGKQTTNCFQQNNGPFLAPLIDYTSLLVFARQTCVKRNWIFENPRSWPDGTGKSKTKNSGAHFLGARLIICNFCWFDNYILMWIWNFGFWNSINRAGQILVLRFAIRRKEFSKQIQKNKK